MNNDVNTLCAECGCVAKSKIHIQLISGIEIATHTDKKGNEQTTKKPNAQHSFDVCRHCFRIEAKRANGNRPIDIFFGLLLVLFGLFLAVIEMKGFINGSVSLWINTGLGIRILPWIAVFIAIMIPWIPFVAGRSLLRRGLASSMTLVTGTFSNKFIEQTVNRLKETDRGSRIFVCTKETLDKGPTLKIWDEAMKLENYCNVYLVREKRVVGAMRDVRVFLNDIKRGTLENGTMMEMQTGLSKNILTVVDDSEDDVDTLEFDAPSGGNVHISVEFPGGKINLKINP
jgi:hypothetical protein